MRVPSVLLPVFVYVLLVFIVLVGLIANSQTGDRARAGLFSANLKNQFEMPVLFLAVVAFALIVRRTDTLFVVLEWLFVLSRLGHAVVHVTINTQPWRGLVFAISSAILLIAWIKLALDVLAA